MNNEVKRLKCENIIWLVFASVCIINIVGDNEEIKYVLTNDSSNKQKANKIFETTIFVTFIIYIYFATRNYYALKEAANKPLYNIKLIGSLLLIAGIICIFYFQVKQRNFIGSPSL